MPEMSFLEQAQKQMEKLKKAYRYSKANASREAAAKLQYERTVCRSQLEANKKNVERVIREQSRNIRNGRAEHQDTSIQQDLVHEAALSYLLLVDAIYALTTVSSYDSIAYAYDVLDAAIEYMSGKPRRMRKVSALPVFGANKRRSAYTALTSRERVLEKENICQQMMPALIESGNIEECLRQVQDENDAAVHYPEEGAPRGVPESDLENMVAGLPEDDTAASRSEFFTQGLGEYMNKR